MTHNRYIHPNQLLEPFSWQLYSLRPEKKKARADSYPARFSATSKGFETKLANWRLQKSEKASRMIQ
jgi:hypothetical protein